MKYLIHLQNGENAIPEIRTEAADSSLQGVHHILHFITHGILWGGIFAAVFCTGILLSGGAKR